MGRSPVNVAETAEILRIQQDVQAGDHYRALGLQPDASTADVEEAYHRFVRSWHPDRFFHRETAAMGAVLDENFAMVTRAFRTLRDPSARANYDAERRRAPSTGSTSMPPRSSLFPTPSRSGASEPSGFETTFRRPASSSTSVSSIAPTGLPTGPRISAAPVSVQKIQDQLRGNLEQAKRYHAAGRADMDAGRLSAAEGNLYLATRFDPTNVEYRNVYQDVSGRGREARAVALVQQAERAETYAQWTEAAALYRKAIALDPQTGAAWFRLARILRLQEDDVRGAVEHYRRAIAKEPRNVDYMIALAETYEQLGLRDNALRLATLALATDRTSAPATALVGRLKR